MGTRDPRIDAYIARSAPFARPILEHIRAAVHAGCPDVEEGMKWSAPHFIHRGLLCGMASFKAHCAFGFWKASLLSGAAAGERPKDAMGQFGRITSIDDLPSKSALIKLVKEAARLNEQGVKVPRRSTRAAGPVTVPDALMKALRRNRKALAAFENFPPSHRREYAEWVAGAKTAATRDRRIATTVEWVAEGKGRNWKYQAKA